MTMPQTAKRPFDIIIRDAPGKPPRVVETIEVEVIVNGDDEFLTPESSERIEQVRAHHMGLMTGNDIKEMRERLGLSQKELTELLQCGEKSLSRWENDHGLPTGLVNTLLRLLDDGLITPDDLYAVRGPRMPRWTPPSFRSDAGRKTPLHYKLVRFEAPVTEVTDKELAAA